MVTGRHQLLLTGCVSAAAAGRQCCRYFPSRSLAGSPEGLGDQCLVAAKSGNVLGSEATDYFHNLLEPAPQHAVPVEPWQHLGFQQPHAIAFLGLIERKAFGWLAVIVELGKHHSVVAGDHRTGRIAVVAGRERPALHRRQQVCHQLRGLLANRCTGL